MKKVIALLLISAVVFSCATVQVTNNWDKQVDFKSFTSYSLYPWDKQNSKAINDYDKNTIITSVKSEMERRGYEYKEKGGELVVSLFVALETKPVTSLTQTTTMAGLAMVAAGVIIGLAGPMAMAGGQVIHIPRSPSMIIWTAPW